MRHWFIKTVIDLFPQLAEAGVVSDWKVEAPADSKTAVLTFKGRDGSTYEIQASRGEPRKGASRGILGFDGGKRTWPGGEIECYDSLFKLVEAAGIASFEPTMA